MNQLKEIRKAVNKWESDADGKDEDLINEIQFILQGEVS